MKSLVVKKGIPLIPVIPFLVLAVMYLILPAAGIVVKGFRTPGTGVFTLNNFQVIFSKVIYQRTIQNSLNLSLLSSAVGLLISFLAALALTAAGNAYARLANRPGALVRLPGIIMLVPGSVALRGVITLVQAQQLDAGQAAGMAALNTLMALLAGIIFGNLAIPARRSL